MTLNFKNEKPVKCKHCGREKSRHKAKTFNCPYGRGNFQNFMPDKVFEPKVKKEKKSVLKYHPFPTKDIAIRHALQSAINNEEGLLDAYRSDFNREQSFEDLVKDHPDLKFTLEMIKCFEKMLKEIGDKK